MKRYDHLKGYCRMLGHELSFDYCRTSNNKLPCRKILDCWFERIEIHKYIEENFSEDEQKEIFKPPQDKVSTIFDLIEKAKKRANEN